MDNNLVDINYDNRGIDLLDASDPRNYYSYRNSPFYIGDKDSLNNNLLKSDSNLTPFTSREKKSFKIIFLALILLLGLSLMVFPASRVGGIFGGLFPLVLFGVFMPYVFLREAVFYIKEKKSQKIKNK